MKNRVGIVLCVAFWAVASTSFAGGMDGNLKQGKMPYVAPQMGIIPMEGGPCAETGYVSVDQDGVFFYCDKTLKVLGKPEILSEKGVQTPYIASEEWRGGVTYLRTKEVFSGERVLKAGNVCIHETSELIRIVKGTELMPVERPQVKLTRAVTSCPVDG